MNKVILMGRMTRDPEIRYTQGSGMAVARFSLAVDRRKKRDDSQGADFPSCVAFDKQAENIGKFFHKGTKILIEGHLQTGSYKNKNGDTVYTTDVIVDTWEFVESKGNTAPAMLKPAANDDEFMQIPDGAQEGLPFN